MEGYLGEDVFVDRDDRREFRHQARRRTSEPFVDPWVQAYLSERGAFGRDRHEYDLD